MLLTQVQANSPSVAEKYHYLDSERERCMRCGLVNGTAGRVGHRNEQQPKRFPVIDGTKLKEMLDDPDTAADRSPEAIARRPKGHEGHGRC